MNRKNELESREKDYECHLAKLKTEHVSQLREEREESAKELE